MHVMSLGDNELGKENLNQLNENVKYLREHHVSNLNLNKFEDVSEKQAFEDLETILKNPFINDNQGIEVDEDSLRDFIGMSPGDSSFKDITDALYKAIEKGIKKREEELKLAAAPPPLPNVPAAGNPPHRPLVAPAAPVQPAVAPIPPQNVAGVAGVNVQQGVVAAQVPPAIAPVPPAAVPADNAPQAPLAAAVNAPVPPPAPPPEPIAHAFKRVARESLAALARGLKIADTVELKAEQENFQTYWDNTNKLKKAIEEEYGITQGVEFNEDEGTLTVPIETQDGGEGEFVRSFDQEENVPRISITNPPSDEAIMFLLDMTSDLKGLQMSRSCGDAETLLRLYEASIISGRPLGLHADDLTLLEGNERYETLKRMSDPANAAVREEFVADYDQNKDNWVLGESELPDIPRDNRLEFH